MPHGCPRTSEDVIATAARAGLTLEAYAPHVLETWWTPPLASIASGVTVYVEWCPWNRAPVWTARVRFDRRQRRTVSRSARLETVLAAAVRAVAKEQDDVTTARERHAAALEAMKAGAEAGAMAGTTLARTRASTTGGDR